MMCASAVYSHRKDRVHSKNPKTRQRLHTDLAVGLAVKNEETESENSQVVVTRGEDLVRNFQKPCAAASRAFKRVRNCTTRYTIRSSYK